MSFLLDPRLVEDTYLIGELPLSSLLLMDDARFPWLILVPRIAGARELLDLDEADRHSLLGELSGIGRGLEILLCPDKLNIAALGNVVPQLHVHLIVRYMDDAVWPQPVWGRGERVRYLDDARATRIAELRKAFATLFI
jgi:diadenosine tetraphosphate (Ap4A) HIT family hydrolase